MTVARERSGIGLVQCTRSSNVIFGRDLGLAGAPAGREVRR
jgi:hypothetical protein